ncbi:DsbA family protein [Microbacteriaceae bacterium 4G12]
MKKIRVYSDFTCPFCFLGKKTMEDAVNISDIEWMPFELRPEGTDPIDPNSSYIQEGWTQSVQPLAARLGIQMTLPALNPHPRTTLAHEGYQYAKAHHKGYEYVQQVFAAFWQEGRDIGCIEVLGDIATEVGLNKEDFEAALQARTYREAHVQALREATHIRAVPTMEIEGNLLQGLQHPERIKRVLEKTTDMTTGDSCSIEGC